jgi:hypothetical protein
MTDSQRTSEGFMGSVERATPLSGTTTEQYLRVRRYLMALPAEELAAHRLKRLGLVEGEALAEIDEIRARIATEEKKS